MCGGAWILRDHTGSSVFNARDAFTSFTNRLTAELRCILWTIKSLADLHIDSVELWSDSAAAIEAITNPRK